MFKERIKSMTTTLRRCLPKLVKCYTLLSLGFILTNWLIPSVAAQEAASDAKQAEQTIWVISDLHHFSPELFDQGQKFEEMQATAAGLDLRYGLKRLKALVKQIEEAKPDVLIVAGDLTLNGELQSMVELADTFQAIEQVGTQVLVIPGNHDLSNPWASSFIGEDTIRVAQTLPEDFEELFAPFGYDDALSRDSASLSYLAEISTDWQVYLLDSNVYSKTAGLYAPKSHGQLKTSTLNWLEKELVNQQKTDSQALVVMHHNSLVHFPSLNQGYTLDNAGDLQVLLESFKLPITLSGHIHAQHIAQQSFSDSFTLTDIATGAFGLFPNRIGVITITDSSFSYRSTELDMDAWLADQTQPDPNLLAWETYMQDLMSASSQRVAQKEIIAHHAYSPQEAQAVIDLFSLMNQATFAGNFNTQWPTLVDTYADLLESLTHYGNEFFEGYLQDLINLKEEDHQNLDLIW